MTAEVTEMTAATASQRPLLEVTDLDVVLGRGWRASHVLRGVNLSVRPGEIVGLVGETGSGKTTLARTVVGLARPRGGRVVFDGREISRLRGAARRRERRAGHILRQRARADVEAEEVLRRGGALLTAAPSTPRNEQEAPEEPEHAPGGRDDDGPFQDEADRLEEAFGDDRGAPRVAPLAGVLPVPSALLGPGLEFGGLEHFLQFGLRILRWRLGPQMRAAEQR